MEELWLERYELVTERIGQIKEEQILPKDWQEYFAMEAEYAEGACEYLSFVQKGGLEAADLKELQRWNGLWEKTWKSLSKEYAPLMDLLSAELRSLGYLAAQSRLEEFLIRLELFAEVYGICVYEWQEEKKLPTGQTLRECLYWYVHDYADMALLQELQYLEKPKEASLYQSLQKYKPQEEARLYQYGLVVTAKERGLYEWLQGISAEEVEAWAMGLAEEIVELINADTPETFEKRILLQYPVGYEKLMCALMRKLRELELVVVPEVVGEGVLLNLYTEDYAGGKGLWDKALGKRCKEIRQTLAEKTKKEKHFSFIRVVLKEDGKEILKPHVV